MKVSALVIVYAALGLGCGSPSRSGQATATTPATSTEGKPSADPVDPVTLQTLNVEAEALEQSASKNNSAVRGISAAKGTLKQILDMRAEIGLQRERELAALKNWSVRPEAENSRKRLEHVIALDDDSCAYLDSIITQLKATSN